VLGAGYTLPDGWVWILMDQRYSGTFSTELNMNAFPMDIQHLEMVRNPTATGDKGQQHAMISLRRLTIVLSFSRLLVTFAQLLQSGWPESVVRLVYPEATPAGIEQVTSAMTSKNLGW